MGISERKEKQRMIKKNDILDAAERVFFTKGYDVATMDDVAKEAEFSKRTVYMYFSSKNEIYFEIMIRGYKLLNDFIIEELEKKQVNNAIDKLKIMGSTLYKFSIENSNYFKAIMEYENGERDFEEEKNDSSKDECYLQGEKIFKYLTNILYEGKKNGEFFEELDVTNTSIVLWSAIIGVFKIVSKKSRYIKVYHNRTEEDIISAAFDTLVRSIKVRG